jgi:hypothetical protein
MYKKLSTMFGALALLGLTAGQAAAVTVTATPGSNIVPADTATALSISIDGNFDVATTGGTFLVSWDAGLTLDTFTIAAPPWDFFFTTVGTNSLQIRVGDLSFTPTTGPRAIATLNFTALLPQGSTATISMADDGNGWADFPGAPLPVDYVGASVTAPVPVPAAAWLMLSGLLGLVGVARRKHA